MPSGEWKYRSLEDNSTYASDDGISETTFTVPDREVWHILSVWAELTATANITTAREVRVLVQDAAPDILMEMAAGVAPDTNADFLFAPGVADLTALRDTDLVMTSLPAGLLLRSGWNLLVRAITDTSATDGDSDVMVVQLTYAVENIMSTAGGTPQTSDN